MRAGRRGRCALVGVRDAGSQCAADRRRPRVIGRCSRCLALIIDDYERKRWPIEPPDTIEAIRFRMETGGYTQADLGRLLGSRQRASDILTRERPLTMSMASLR